jgi:adenylate kinase family enzyme
MNKIKIHIAGPCGAGKSTIAAQICSLLRDCGIDCLVEEKELTAADMFVRSGEEGRRILHVLSNRLDVGVTMENIRR